MTKILVTGATGFLGSYVIEELLRCEVLIVATSSSLSSARNKSWFEKVKFIEYHIQEKSNENLFEKFGHPDAVIHLAWGGLPHFKDKIHIDEVLPAQKDFVQNLVSNGLKNLLITGTCLEYGMQEGELYEDLPAKPEVPYAIAKNLLRIFTESLKAKYDFNLKWVRLFYMYGAGQYPKSIIPQLEASLKSGEKKFNMSKGDQVRDYLPVESVARNIVIFALQNTINGIINCCSNKPVTVKKFITDYLITHNKHIELNLGFYPYADYEPFKFWGNNKKQTKIISMNPIEEFKQERADRISSYGTNKELKDAAAQFNNISNRDKYSYNFSWMGRPIIQYPQDMVAMQELIWDIKPDLIIETGIAHGGSLIFYASIMELIGKGEILGVDIDIREHNRLEIEAHPMAKRIKMIQGSAVDQSIVDQVKKHAEGKKTIMVSLDSNHTHEHVLKELELYSPFVTVGSYCVVFDTIVEDLPKGMYDRPWDVGNNPKTAVFEFLKTNNNFVIDKQIDNKLLISVAPDGYLKRIK